MSKFIEQTIAIVDDVVQEANGRFGYVNWNSIMLRKHLEAREAVTAALVEALGRLLIVIRPHAIGLDASEGSPIHQAVAALALAKGQE